MPDTSTTVDGDEGQQPVGHKSYRRGTHDNPILKNIEEFHTFWKTFENVLIIFLKSLSEDVKFPIHKVKNVFIKHK